jgi:lysyl-tRNA synthetase class 2
MIVQVLVGVAASWVLIRARAAFPARVLKGSLWRSAAVLLVGIGIAAALGFVLVTVWGQAGTGMWQRAWWALNVALGQGPEEVIISHTEGGPWSLRHAARSMAPWWVSRLVSLAATLGLLSAFAVFMRSARTDTRITPADELHLRQLLLQGGAADSLGYFNTRRDKSVQFSPDGRAAIAYTRVGSTLLASGDPVGERSSWPDAIGAWLDLARGSGWTPAVIAASTRGGKAYEAQGLRTLAIGDEAVIHTNGFSLRGPALRDVKATVGRIKRAGYTAQVRRQGDIGAAELAALVDLADRWRRGGPERGFSMTSSRLGDPTDARNVVVTAHDDAGRVRGLLTFVPWGPNGVSLDIMRHDPDAHGGTVELMVTTLAETGPDMGLQRISLNFAVLRRVFSRGEEVGAFPMQRLNRKVMVFLSRWWQLESLYRSNDKYAPAWYPRLLVYDKGAHLTEVLIAVGQAEGLLPELSIGDRLARRPRRDLMAGPPEDLDAFAEQVRAQEVAAFRAVGTERRRKLSEQETVRRANLAALEAAGIEGYPVEIDRDRSVGQAREAALGDQVAVCGRVMRRRHHGGVTFVDLREGTDEIQVLADRSVVDAPGRAQDYRTFVRHVDLGDIVAVRGEVMRTRTGELTIAAQTWDMASKALAPLPSKRRSGARVPSRLRHIELATSSPALEAMRRRSAATASLRASLGRRGFIEVETPMLQAIHGGANARPFRTHINAYDQDLYLRIAPELALKQLMVGGMGRIFELGRNFRNEGADSTHNPEFTSLEAYQAYADYTTMRELTRELIIEAAVAVHGSPVAHRPDGQVVDLDAPWPVIAVHEAVSRAVGQEVTAASPPELLREIARAQGVHADDVMSSGEIVSELYDALVEAKTTFPTFYVDFPVETSPLTRANRHDRRLAERWDLVAFGAELGTAYSELADPLDERRRLTEQSLRAAAGDPEAMELDEAFLTALEFGMPPTGGLGLGVDRMVMMLSGTTIRQTLTFPFMKPVAS